MIGPTATIRTHEGQTLLLLADKYPHLYQVILEGVQNAIDNNATLIDVRLNWKQRQISIRDNGEGAGEARFHDALRHIADTRKEVGKLGRFGIGLISPLGKCEKFTFTSCQAPNVNGYIEWTMRTADIKSTYSNIQLPQRLRTDLKFNQNGTWWRTEVRIYNFTEDKNISQVTIPSLKSEILSSYGTAMVRAKTTVELMFTDTNGNITSDKFKGDTFTGKKLPDVEYHFNDCGKIVFKMFLTTKKQRDLQQQKAATSNVKFGELNNDFRVSFKNLSRSVTSGGIGPNPEVMEAFRSGIFEGEILGEKLEITKSRLFFAINDAFADFSDAINKWYNEHGKKYFSEAKEESRDERYQTLGNMSLQNIRSLLQKNESLLNALKGMSKYGTIGPGHIQPDQKVIGTQASLSKSIDGGGQKSSGGGGGGSNSIPKKEKSGHVPLSTQGSAGVRRKIVRDNSFGMQLAYDQYTGSANLWILDRDHCEITINTTHPDWALIESSDASVLALQEHIIITVLTLEMVNPANYAQHKMFADLQLKNLAATFIRSSPRANIKQARGRKPKKAI